MKRITRVRWTADERAAVVRRAQTLLAQDPSVSSSSLFAKSQEGLPSERRRRPSPSVHAWLRNEVRRAGPLPSPAETWRPTEGDEVGGRNDSPTFTNVSSGDQRSHQESEPRSPIVEALIQAGVQVLTGILTDARVRLAIWTAIHGDATPSRIDDVVRHASSEDASKRDRLVVVAGCSTEEAQVLKKKLDGALPLSFWSADAPREQLLRLLPQADLVIGIVDNLPHGVENSLTRLGPRYVRHTGGMPALYRRLAERALG